MASGVHRANIGERNTIQSPKRAWRLQFKSNVTRLELAVPPPTSMGTVCQVVNRDLDVQKQKTTGHQANYSREIDRIRKGFFIEVGNTWQRNGAILPGPLFRSAINRAPAWIPSLPDFLAWPQPAHIRTNLNQKKGISWGHGGSQVKRCVFGACLGRLVPIYFGSGTEKVSKPAKAKPSSTKDEVLTAIKLGKAG